MTLSIVIPAYNEAEALPGLLVRVLEVVDSLSAATEVIIVDDGPPTTRGRSSHWRPIETTEYVAYGFRATSVTKWR